MHACAFLYPLSAHLEFAQKGEDVSTRIIIHHQVQVVIVLYMGQAVASVQEHTERERHTHTHTHTHGYRYRHRHTDTDSLTLTHTHTCHTRTNVEWNSHLEGAVKLCDPFLVAKNEHIPLFHEAGRLHSGGEGRGNAQQKLMRQKTLCFLVATKQMFAAKPKHKHNSRQ